MEKKSLQGYKKPVLTLLGDKDGYLNYLYSLQEYQDLEKRSWEKQTNYY